MYLAAAELTAQGFNVTPTSRNMAGVDLLITDNRCHNTWTIQVKTADQRAKQRRGWLIGKTAKRTAHKTHAYVLVVLNKERHAEYFIVPSKFVAAHQCGAASMPEFRRKDAERYYERWDILRRES
jgi:hypothetical protein